MTAPGRAGGAVCQLDCAPAWKRSDQRSLLRSSPTQELFANFALRQNRLASQGRLIENSERARERPVNRDDIALPNREAVALDDRVQRSFFKGAVALTHRHPRRVRQQRSHFALRATFSEAFQILPARIHQSHNRCRKL